MDREIDMRKMKGQKEKQIASGLGFPLRRREDGIVQRAMPLQRRVLELPKVKSTAPGVQPEIFLEIPDYEFILSVLENMAMVIERSPQRLGALSEETLRDIFLITLNGHYESATGETFNVKGKTDILIRAENKNIFIAECKFWGGPKLLQETVDQLLGYTSWRDTKTALIIFNRNKDFTNVLRQIPETIQSLGSYKRRLETIGESRSRYVLHQPNDPNREVILTVLAFDVPTK